MKNDVSRTTSLSRWSLFGVLAFAALGLGLRSTADPSVAGVAGPRVAGPAKYVGASKCKACHSKEASGHQYGAWEKSKHSQAFAVLLTPEAKVFGDARGIADPSVSDDCTKCHTTGLGVAAELRSRKFDGKNVQCEVCHGPGGNHVRARLMAAAEAEDEDDAFAEEAAPAYVVVPDKEIIKAPTVETCVQCHNEESPGYQPFCFHERVAQIRHLNPKKPRTPAELELFTQCSCEATCLCKKGRDDGSCRSNGGALDSGDGTGSAG